MKTKLITLSFVVILSCYSKIYAQKWTKVSCGAEFSVGIKSDGSLWSWGRNANGELGIGGTKDQTMPYHVGTDKDWKEVYAGGSHVIAIKNDGTLWAWGNCTFGQAGLGAGSDVNDVPAQIGTDNDWVKAATGYASTYVLKKSGLLYCCGFNFFGELGDSSNDNLFTLKPVWGNYHFKDVSAGSLHAAAVGTDGTLWAWGYGQDGELGQGVIKSSIYPIRVGKDSDWVAVAAGGQFTIALKKDGSIWSWGAGSKGQLGQGNSSISLVPMQIGTDKDWRSIACGSEFAFGIKTNNTLYGWGDNKYGEISADSVQANIPANVDSSKDWISISGATPYVVNQTSLTILGHHAIGLKASNNGFCGAGINNYSQLGNDDTAIIRSFDCSLGLKSGIKSFPAINEEISIYPNPGSGKLSVNINDPEQRGYIINLKNINGENLISNRTESSASFFLDLTGYPKGVYFLQLMSGNSVQTKKIIVD
jgi:alpha-tubulin suppressor-like RCC1 family protein